MDNKRIPVKSYSKKLGKNFEQDFNSFTFAFCFFPFRGERLQGRERSAFEF